MVSLADGREIGRVRHVVLDTECSRVVGFAVDVGCWWRGCPVLPVEQVVGMGGEAVTVLDADCLSPVERGSDLERIARAEYALTGRLVLSREGTSVGRVSDYSFDIESGRLSSLEVSAEPPDEGRGPVLVRAQQVLVFGRDAIVVGGLGRPAGDEPASAGSVASGGYAELPESTAGHDHVTLPAAASKPSRDAGKRPEGQVATTTAHEGEAVPSEAEAAPGSGPIQALGGSLPAAELVRMFQERQERFLLGKVARRAVRGEDGEVIVAAGTVVTAELLAKVKEADRLLDLTASVSLRG